MNKADCPASRAPSPAGVGTELSNPHAAIIRIIRLSEKLNPTDLEKRLNGAKELSLGGIRFSRDGSVRFAPRGSYKFIVHTSGELAKQGDVVANYGVEGAQQIGEVSSKFKYKPITFGLNVHEGEEPIQRVASISSAMYIDDGLRLDVGGSYVDSYDNGFAFGISE